MILESIPNLDISIELILLLRGAVCGESRTYGFEIEFVGVNPTSD
jgi:hypothetical protein